MADLPTNIPLSSQNTMDEYLKSLQTNKEVWINIDPHQRILLLDEIKKKLLDLSDKWIKASCQEKGIPEQSYGEGEEWMFLAIIVRAIRLISHSLNDIIKYGKPKIPGNVSTRSNGQVTAKVFPQNTFEKILFKGITCEVWMEPGVTEEMVNSTQAKIYQNKDHTGRVCLVLGAGNLALTVILDFLYKLFVEDQVIILKMNSVNSYIGPLIEEAFNALVEQNFIRIVYGDAEEGDYLCNHPAVDQIHITGSEKTFETIVFGSDEEALKRKAAKRPLLTKPITSELGNITPVIIVPGPWSDRDIYLQALKLASWIETNAGFNCLSPRLIIQHKDWEFRDKFTKTIKNILSKMKTRNAYYPGAKERQNAFIKSHPDAFELGNPEEGHLPWTFITDVDPSKKDDICFNTEAFCGLFSETALDALDVEEYIDKAVKFTNETVRGSLTSSIIVHPKTLKNPKIAAAVENAISNLKYGSICMNLRTEYAYLCLLTTWGAFPGHEIDDIQSGTGVIDNFLMFEKPQKSVHRGPFNIIPDPFVVTSNQLYKFGKKMMHFEASPSISKLPGLIWTALRS